MWSKRTHAPGASRGSRSVITPRATRAYQYIQSRGTRLGRHSRKYVCIYVPGTHTQQSLLILNGSTGLHYVLLYFQYTLARYCTPVSRVFPKPHICVIVPAGINSPNPAPFDMLLLYIPRFKSALDHAEKITGSSSEWPSYHQGFHHHFKSRYLGEKILSYNEESRIRVIFSS